MAVMAKASLLKAEDDLSKTTIYSPLDGTITKLNSQLGERVVGTAMMAGTEIMTQFILEAIILCEVGGGLGVVLGIIGGNLAGQLLRLPVVIPVDAIVIGLGICSIVGMVFGTYPAYKAANLDPIDSLRYE